MSPSGSGGQVTAIREGAVEKACSLRELVWRSLSRGGGGGGGGIRPEQGHVSRHPLATYVQGGREGNLFLGNSSLREHLLHL